MAGRVPQLVIFLRAPQRGAVKRRLAEGIGARAAYQFYRTNATALIRRLGGGGRWRGVLALTPDALARSARLFGDAGRGWARMAQGRGDLGRRMARVIGRLPPGPVVIVGGDIPAIERPHIEAAFRTLARCEAVFGPAHDGGYWLIGLARRRHRGPALLRRLFRGVRWSGPHALADTRANLPPGSEGPELPVLHDIDDAASFARLGLGRG